MTMPAFVRFRNAKVSTYSKTKAREMCSTWGKLECANKREGTVNRKGWGSALVSTIVRETEVVIST